MCGFDYVFLWSDLMIGFGDEFDGSDWKDLTVKKPRHLVKIT